MYFKLFVKNDQSIDVFNLIYTIDTKYFYY